MRDNTSIFIKIINQTIKENETHFSFLESIKTDGIQQLSIQILDDLQISYENKNLDFSKILQKHIKGNILSRKNEFSMDTKILSNISTQLEIEYLLKKISKDDVEFYCSISDALTYYGIYRGSRILSFQHIDFWKDLIKKIYLLNMINSNQYSNCFSEHRYRHPDFNKLPKLISAIKNIEEKLKEEIDIIDSVVVFRKNQEDRIINKIEKKLSLLNLFDSLRFIFNLYQDKKEKNQIEYTIPYKYIVNILVKNISYSKHKFNNNKNKSINAIELLCSFISLYQLKEDRFEMMNISEHNLVEHLKKQVFYSNFYPLYSLKTNTLIEYIEYIIKPSIKEELFHNKFGFNTNDLIDFFKMLDTQTDDIVTFSRDNIFNNELNILELFSINADQVNKNYTTIKNLSNSLNLFTMNPIIQYKNEFYIIGFKYFKMNFYNSLVEKIRKNLDKDINQKIGSNVDIFVETIFDKIKNKHGYEVFSGNYKPPKKENPESDLLLKSQKEIILIENKNKYLTNLSFSGSDSNILKDFVLSFAFSQKQLLKHERNLKKYKEIRFTKDQRELTYENQNIVKMSVSTNNWFNIMNNDNRQLLLSMIRLRFDIEEDKIYDNKNAFIKANKYLDELNEIISELYEDDNFDMGVVLTQTLFLPLELIVDKYKDDNFIKCLKTLVGMKMNTDNILNIYDYYQYLNSYKSPSSKST
ncbi:MAG: hypothetical protein K6L60_05105 [Oceanobacter sp.]